MQAQFDYEAEQEEKKKQMATKKKPVGAGKTPSKEEPPAQVEARLVFNERVHPCSMTQVCECQSASFATSIGLVCQISGPLLPHQ